MENLKFSSKKDNGSSGSKKHNNLKKTSDDIESGDNMEITMQEDVSNQ